jgi:hypothetical protein
LVLGEGGLSLSLGFGSGCFFLLFASLFSRLAVALLLFTLLSLCL